VNALASEVARRLPLFDAGTLSARCAAARAMTRERFDGGAGHPRYCELGSGGAGTARWLRVNIFAIFHIDLNLCGSVHNSGTPMGISRPSRQMLDVRFSPGRWLPPSFRKAFHIIGNDNLRRVSFANGLQVF
jgi:hypothetical protein